MSYLAEARNSWSALSPSILPVSFSSQRQWDDIICKRDRARLLALSAKESGYWLHAFPSANLGTILIDDDSVDTYGNHGLSCSRSAGRFSRHSTINDIIRRSLATVHVPAVIEPIGLARSDGKRPDGMTLIPWRLGRSLLWDATCVDTLAASHIQATSSMVGAAATDVEQAKRRKNENLDISFIFVPFGEETLGPWGPEARALFKELSKRVIESSSDPRAGTYLGQRISLAIQRGNAASILGTVPRCGGFEDVLDFI
ncbi:jg21941 [Pararge aegeria aegeria]|uniref:Jg21941 protein n=1 Tax=Pararge aegeria aegeria TaxID=348720 RepID=A0A8S4SGU6_9NEOP|nr:jg21941 [Pararge aegeria aegeria]